MVVKRECGPRQLLILVVLQLFDDPDNSAMPHRTHATKLPSETHASSFCGAAASKEDEDKGDEDEGDEDEDDAVGSEMRPPELFSVAEPGAESGGGSDAPAWRRRACGV